MTSWTAAHQASLSSLSPRVCSDSCSLSRWCYLTISSSVYPFSFCLKYFPSSGSFPVSGLFASGGQAIGTSASASVLPMNIQDWFPLWLIGLISLQAKGLSRVQYHNEIYEIDSNKDFISFFFFFWTPKALQMVTAGMKLKDACSLEEKLWPT